MRTKKRKFCPQDGKHFGRKERKKIANKRGVCLYPTLSKKS